MYAIIFYRFIIEESYISRAKHFFLFFFLILREYSLNLFRLFLEYEYARNELHA